ncbi:hypothetical protein ABEB36_003536 [Hypothenemus hampei]|uniref:ZAD domain-containing protein n=1 Tax=Hypothenemus hampei TaxID=57062 RepID=A0ABD1FBC3_HYPHA
MGSINQAPMVGFLCRLCSKTKKEQIYIYSSKAQRLDLLNKLKVLPINIDRYDNLPKTICQSCIEKLEFQYQMFKKFRQSETVYQAHRTYHSNGNCPEECPLHGIC